MKNRTVVQEPVQKPQDSKNGALPLRKQSQQVHRTIPVDNVRRMQQKHNL
jgi:hypothetical protein